MEQIKLTERKAGLLLDKVRDAVRVGAQAIFDLCWLLYECDRSVVYVGDDPVFVYETWGYKDWFDFVEVEVGVHAHTANVYRKIGRVFGEDLNGAWDTGEPLPVTKMAILAAWPDLTRQNVRSKMKWARKKTCCQMQHELLGRERPIQMAFGVSEAEQRDINKAIKLARGKFDEGGEMTRGELIANILHQWAAIAKKQKPNLRLAG
ncbi:hypothetical protein LCGC14_2076730 [marine sediment metagenome]|uniref:Uncharacterized protein n=1 Tax=marine sediment metagenome TaxID=412755 RepID=A0A0F9GV88_9ZZZZ